MEKPISYEDAIRRFPSHVAEVIEAARKSRSKYKNTNPEDWAWKIFWGVRIPQWAVMNGAQFFGMVSRAEMPARPTFASEEEYMSEFTSRVEARLLASFGRGWGWSSESLIAPVPEECLAPQLLHYREQQTQEKRIANQTPEERDAEISKLVKELSRNPGFIKL